MEALAGDVQDYYMEFVQINPANGEEQRVYQFHSVSLAIDGDFDLVSDAFALLSFKGSAQSNAVTGKTLTVDTHGAV